MVEIQLNVAALLCAIFLLKIPPEKYHVHDTLFCCLKVLQSIFHLSRSHRAHRICANLIQFLVLFLNKLSIQQNPCLDQKTNQVHSNNSNRSNSSIIVSTKRFNLIFDNPKSYDSAYYQHLNYPVHKLSLDQPFMKFS